MVIFKNLPFLIWFAFFIRSLKPLKINIKKYRDEGNFQLERQEIKKAENAFADALTEKVKIKVNITKEEELPDGPCVFVSNHQSYWDIPAFCIAVREKQFGFVAKEELGKIPLFGSWISDIRSVFIKRDDARASLRAIEEGVELLKLGFSLVIFPEGTRSKSNDMAEFKKGSLRLATKAGVPVVPITIDGSFKAYEEKGVVKPAEIDFHIHKSIETKDMTRSEASNLAAVVEKTIRDYKDSV